jgi:tetratricopeptide (TPR) repeat protein
VAADSKVKLLEEAERYVLNGKIRPAISQYLKIIESDPNDAFVLNTIGDLYLRLNDASEANRFFMRVADNYAGNNFIQKAIAVYKKILNNDPENFEVNLTIASLYGKQGSSVNACRQYRSIADILEKNGNNGSELPGIYEKIAELDPLNYRVQQKLAELFSAAEGSDEKAHSYWLGAARAQMKAGEPSGALQSFQRAAQIAPLDVAAMRGVLECSIKLGDTNAALEQLEKSVEETPQDLDMREMLGSAYLAEGEFEAAGKVFQVLVSMDESRYGTLFPVVEAFLLNDMTDQALTSLDVIIPILITRRETARAAKFYDSILERNPKHVLTLIKSATLYSATDDSSRYLEALDRLVEHYLDEDRPIEALEYLEKIIQEEPENERYLQLHHQAFTQGYPDVPYTPPVAPEESAMSSMDNDMDSGYVHDKEGSVSENVVEVDLLLNYGLKDKALSLLLNLEASDPNDKGVRARLLSLHKSEQNNSEAAVQCLLLAAISRGGGDEESARSYLDEARQLDPDTVSDAMDLMEFAGRYGVTGESGVTESQEDDPYLDDVMELDTDAELDLSSDLLESFAADSQETESVETIDFSETPESEEEALSPDVAAGSMKSVDEQLQEVDFYLRLGFLDEARDKLTEISSVNSDHPALASRLEKLKETEPQDSSEEIIFSDTSDTFFDESIEISRPDTINAAASVEQNIPPAESGAESSERRDLDSSGHDSLVNEMFADLMEEVSSSESPEAARASFEDHFSLGLAYRDMDLTDDAIKEFEAALKGMDMRKGDPQVIQCCGMLSTCFLKKNMPASALRWCQAGLNLAGSSSHEAMAFRYDMGNAHSMAGDTGRALECFKELFGMDPGYRDVAQRIDELKHAS